MEIITDGKSNTNAQCICTCMIVDTYVQQKPSLIQGFIEEKIGYHKYAVVTLPCTPKLCLCKICLLLLDGYVFYWYLGGIGRVGEVGKILSSGGRRRRWSFEEAHPPGRRIKGTMVVV